MPCDCFHIYCLRFQVHLYVSVNNLRTFHLTVLIEHLCICQVLLEALGIQCIQNYFPFILLRETDNKQVFLKNIMPVLLLAGSNGLSREK